MTIISRESLNVRPVTVKELAEPIVLSPMDNVMPRMPISVLYLFDSTAFKAANTRNFMPFELLRASLSEVINSYPILAGRLQVQKNGGFHVIQHNQGVSLLRQDADITLESILPSRSVRNLQALGFSNWPTELATPAIFSWNEQTPITTIRVTYFKCHSVSIHLSVSHNVADGPALFQFVNDWSATMQSLALNTAMYICNPVHDRSLLYAQGPTMSEYQHLEYKIPIKSVSRDSKDIQPDAEASVREIPSCQLGIFHFPRDELERMKHEACITLNLDDESRIEGLSTFDVLSAHIWQVIVKARGVTSNAQRPVDFLCGFAVDGRSRLQPPLPQTYFGCANFYGLAKTSLSHLCSDSLRSYGQVASAINLAKSRMTPDYLRSAISFLDRQPDQSLIQPGFSLFLGPDIAVTAWNKLGLYKANFGYGLPSYVGPGNTPWDGLAIYLPTEADDGSIDVCLGLAEGHWKRMVQQGWIRRFCTTPDRPQSEIGNP